MKLEQIEPRRNESGRFEFLFSFITAAGNRAVAVLSADEVCSYSAVQTQSLAQIGELWTDVLSEGKLPETADHFWREQLQLKLSQWSRAIANVN